MSLHRLPLPHAPWLRTVVSACAMGAVSVSAQAPTDLRLALVIGNSAYVGAPLLNPANDARAMSEALKAMGFTVIEARDASKAQMQQALAQAGAALKGKNGVGMLYYAGHGLQLDWHNYMVPVDAKLGSAAEVPAQTVDVQAVVDAFKLAGNRMNIVVLDACRDNPFAATASAKGLAPMDAPTGTFLAYATAPGNVAEDGDAKSGNGLYTQFLVQEMQQPSTAIENVFKRVRLQVRKQSRGRQVPWESTSLEDDFYFNTGTTRPPKATEREKEAAFAREKTDWDRIKDSKSVDDFYDYLQKYPAGSASELAEARLERLAAARVVPQADRSGEIQNPVVNRFRLGDRYEFVLKDGLTGLERVRFKAQVNSIDGDVARYTGMFGPGTKGASTVAGAVLEDSSGSYDPPYTLIPGGEYQVGKRWSGRSIRTSPRGGQGWFDYSGRIVGRERIEVGAGAFDTYKVEMDINDEDGSRRKITWWSQPEWGFPLKMIIEIRERSGGAPTIFVRETLARQRTP